MEEWKMASSLQFWLSYNNNAERLRLPVNPETIKISSGHQYNDVNIVTLGEFTVIGKHKLTDISFSSFFPRDYDASYCEYESLPDPYDTCFNVIGRWKESGNPIRITITGTPINYACTIRKFDFEEKFGSPGDVYYDLQLKEYAFVHVKKVQDVPTASGAPAAKLSAKPQRPNTRVAPTSYTVKAGDNLTKISLRLRAQGVTVSVDQLYQLNKGIIGKNRNLIKPGQVLKLA
jgi:LysM repeat protein